VRGNVRAGAEARGASDLKPIKPHHRPRGLRAPGDSPVAVRNIEVVPMGRFSFLWARRVAASRAKDVGHADHSAASAAREAVPIFLMPLSFWAQGERLSARSGPIRLLYEAERPSP
jgi:hypothetical protein